MARRRVKLLQKKDCLLAKSVPVLVFALWENEGGRVVHPPDEGNCHPLPMPPRQNQTEIVSRCSVPFARPLVALGGEKSQRGGISAEEEGATAVNFAIFPSFPRNKQFLEFEQRDID